MKWNCLRRSLELGYIFVFKFCLQNVVARGAEVSQQGKVYSQMGFPGFMKLFTKLYARLMLKTYEKVEYEEVGALRVIKLKRGIFLICQKHES